MKKTTLTLMSVVFGLCFLIFACRREINSITKSDQQKVSESLVESAKILNAKTLGDNAAINAQAPGFFTLAPLWNNASTLSTNNGDKVLVVPTLENEVSNRAVYIRRVFIFETSGNKVTSGRIVEFIGINNAVTQQLTNLIKDIHSSSSGNFNGAVIQYDLNYRWIEGAMYVGGQIKVTDIALSKSDGGKNTYLSKISKDATGKLFSNHLILLYNESRPLHVTEDLSEVTISTTPAGGDGGGGSYGQGGTGGDPPPPPPGWNTTSNSWDTNQFPPDYDGDVVADSPNDESLYADWSVDFTYLQLPKTSLPSFQTLISNYHTFGNSSAGMDKAWAMLGGDCNVAHLTNPYEYYNACAAEVSYALNHSGLNIPEIPNVTKKGADGKNYILGTWNLKEYLKKTVLTPPIIIKHANGTPIGESEYLTDMLSAYQGIIVIQAASSNSYGASGHATLISHGNAVAPSFPKGGASEITIFKVQ